MQTKYKEIAQRLRAQINAGQYAAARKLPSEAALAQRFSASRQTVRRALSLLEQEGLLARRHGSGSYLTDAVPLTRRAALLLPDGDDRTFAALAQRFREGLARRGVEAVPLTTQDSTEGERACLQALLRGGFCGAAVCGVRTGLPTVNLDLYQALGAQGFPLVFVQDRPRELAQFPCASLDMADAGARLADHLAEMGHKKFGGLFRGDSLSGQDMFAGMHRALEKLALPLPDSRVLWFDAQELDALRGGSRTLEQKLTERLRGCTALVCQSEEVALWVVHLLTRGGTRVPGDVSVAACGGGYYSALSHVPLTSLEPAAPGLGTAAADLLLAVLDGKDAAVGDVTLGWRLVRRASTAAPGAV